MGQVGIAVRNPGAPVQLVSAGFTRDDPGLRLRPRVQPHDRVSEGAAPGVHRDQRLALRGEGQPLDLPRVDSRLFADGCQTAAEIGPVGLRIQFDAAVRIGPDAVFSGGRGQRAQLQIKQRGFDGRRADVRHQADSSWKSSRRGVEKGEFCFEYNGAKIVCQGIIERIFHILKYFVEDSKQ